MTIPFKFDLVQNGSDEVILYWRADDVLEEQLETLLPGLWYVVGFSINAILGSL
jgi:hypothetical protein